MDDLHASAGSILEMLREIELMIAELYKRFARAFPEDRALWDDLSRDEERHAEAASALRVLMDQPNAPPLPSRINLAALSTYRKGLEYHLHRLEREEIGRKSALFIARDIEKTLVERAFYELVENEDPGYQAGRAQIEGETESHLGRLEAYIGRTAKNLP